MAKFSRDRFPPGFFDLPRDAGETLPLDVITGWTTSAQTPEVARTLLGPRTLKGAVVSTDSAGLTRLTRERPLIEILAMVNRPKELIHGYGRAIGGRGIGVWAADNTQMFYQAGIAGERVVGMLLTAMDHLGRECEVGIGMAAHLGEFFELGSGVYGPDADRVETVAEEHTEGGELVVTDDLVRRLPDLHGFTLRPRRDLAAHYGGVFRVTGGPRLEGLEATDLKYPAPYSSDFYEGLSTYTRTRRDSVAPRPAYQELAVVLIERESEEPDVPEVAVLNDLALTAAMKRIGGTLLAQLEGTEIKNAGLISLYTFSECRAAVEFARAFRQALLEQGIHCRIGIDVGPVLVFQLGPGSRDIAGSAVNIASKLAQDVGEFGKIRLSDAAAKLAGAKGERPTLTFTVSGVELSAYDV
ncbi:MAG: family 3 adenylate cyclase [Gemmatimonadetes bacterium]|nr:family 3 adenylate cyclase [Gemmatimonadota bacterium]